MDIQRLYIRRRHSIDKEFKNHLGLRFSEPFTECTQVLIEGSSVYLFFGG
jgi:hypothetical protein